MEPIKTQMNEFIDSVEKPSGKNFSRNRPRADRAEADFYQTPHCLTQTFVDTHVREYWNGAIEICDFCCGKMAIADVLDDNGFYVIKGDIKYNSDQDFFNVKDKEDYGIMNPPFRLFNKWVEHCFEVFDVSFALLAPTTYLQGVSRFNRDGTGIFQKNEYPLTHIYTFNRYPMLSAELRPDGLIKTGMQALSWYVWKKMNYPLGVERPEPIHRWLDIDDYVLRKRRIRK
jgi:hypothetical protein